MPKVSVVSLGCPKNLVDSENLLTKLGGAGFCYTPEVEDADLVLVNTCGFIEEAKKESVEEILKLRHLRGKDRKLLVFGCLAERYGEELRKEIPEIDGLWGVGEEDKIVRYCRDATAMGRNQRGIVRGRSPVNTSPYAYLKVAEGCSRACSYCVIPSLRGPFRSLDPEGILKKAEEHVRGGARELVLVAQDLGSYGREYAGYTLSSLARDLSSISGDFWIRLLYLNPSSVDEEFLRTVADADKICKYLDIPLQHSEGRILKAMRRGGSRTSLARLVKRVRETVPGVTLRTTFIVGFPGETEEDFAGLKRFVKETGFEHLGVFTYSREEGTPAAKMKGNVPKRVKERRRDEIMRLQSSISLEKNRSLVGKSFRALVDEVEEDTAIARLSSQAPEIDGVVIIERSGAAPQDARGPKKEKSAGGVFRASRFPRPGEFVTVKITEAYDYDLKGEAV